MKLENVYDLYDQENIKVLGKIADELMNKGQDDLAKEVFALNLTIMKQTSKTGNKILQLKKKLKKHNINIEVDWETGD